MDRIWNCPTWQLLIPYLFIAIYLLAVLGFGLLVSTFCDTQQQAMFIMFFFMMIFILMGGLFTSIDSMPDWARMVSRFNPVSYLIEVMRMVIIKGSTLTDVVSHLILVACLQWYLTRWRYSIIERPINLLRNRNNDLQIDSLKICNITS